MTAKEALHNITTLTNVSLAQGVFKSITEAQLINDSIVVLTGEVEQLASILAKVAVEKMVDDALDLENPVKEDN